MISSYSFKLLLMINLVIYDINGGNQIKLLDEMIIYIKIIVIYYIMKGV